MVIVQPLPLLVSQHVEEHGAEVVGTKGEVFKVQEVPHRGFKGRLREERVLNAYAETPRDVDARLIGDGLSGAERERGAGAEVFPNLHRTFVNSEPMADAVARAVTVVHALAPHGSPCERVELEARGVLGEYRPGELQMALQYERVGLPLLIGQRSEGDGSRDVGGAAVVVCAAVEEQESAAFEADIRLGRRLIVNDGTVRAIGSNRLEGESAAARLFHAQRGRAKRGSAPWPHHRGDGPP